MIKTLLTFFLAFMLLQVVTSQVNNITQNFGTAPPATWDTLNMSNPIGTTSWFQGNTTVFSAQNGAAKSYLAANFNNTGATGTISNWIFTPLVNLNNGGIITFYTRKDVPDLFADRLEVRLSTNGASDNVGADEFSVGDYSTLLLSINPTLALGVYPTTWTQYTITLSGLPAGYTPGKIAFRYFVENAGSAGTNSDYIGIDHFTYAAGALPVTLINFSAGVSADNTVNLQWQTAMEINSSYFSVERSLDGRTFCEIGKVNAAGNSTTTQTYRFSDGKAAQISRTSLAYYRLRQVDADAKQTLSNIAQAKFKRDNIFSIDYATLINSNVFVRYNSSQPAQVKIRLINSNGQVIVSAEQSAVAGLNTYQTPKDLPKGVYIITIDNGNEIVSSKMAN